MITAPVVVGARLGELERVGGAAAGLGLVTRCRHQVGPDRFVVELDQGSSGSAADSVRSLRAAGVAAVAGPPGPGHEVVWARRNGPSWWAEGAGVCFPWSPVSRHGVDLIEIDPGDGFGSGHHPTTQLMLRRLADLVADDPRASLGGRRVLDMGCGTGVLAIAAARAGADQVTAVDIAPAALAATTANAARNDVGHRVEIAGRLIAAASGYDVIVANILAPVLVELAPQLSAALAPGGRLLLSGLSPAQVSKVSAAYHPLQITWTDRLEDWQALQLEGSSRRDR